MHEEAEKDYREDGWLNIPEFALVEHSFAIFPHSFVVALLHVVHQLPVYVKLIKNQLPQ